MAQLKIPCGCQSRKEIMGNGDWKVDAAVAGSVVILIAFCVLLKPKVDV